MTFRTFVRLFAAALVLSTTVIATGAPAAHAAGPALLGGGSGFAALEIDQWRADTARSPYNLNINYVAQGSTFGRNQFTGGQFDYGASDIRYIPAEIPDLQAQRCGGRPIGQCMVYVPVSAGGLAFMYNLKDNSGNRITDLRLSRDAVCKIFTGQITKWNDPGIVSLNRKLASNSSTIGAVVRDDGAGESYVLSEYCMAVDLPVWNKFVDQQTHSSNTNLDDEFVAHHPTSKWPTNSWFAGARPIPLTGAENLANYIADPTSGPNTIGYAAAGYAKVRNFPSASVENGVHAFTQPDEDNVTRALAKATGNGDGTFKLAYNSNDALAYFPSTYSYVLAQTTGWSAAKGAVLAQFLCYAVGKRGQDIAPTLRYARLSRAIEVIAIDAISRIPGAPPKATCPVGGLTDFLGIETFGGSGGTFGGGGGGGGGSGGGGGGNNNNGTASGTNSTTSNTNAVLNARVVAQQRAAAKAAAKAAAIAKAQAAADAKAAAAAQAGDAALANTPIAAKTGAKGSGISLIWILAAGAAAAWALMFVFERRKAAS